MDSSYDNLGGFSNGAPQVPAGSGDIILASSVKSGKTKKKWIVVAAALAVAAIIGLLIWLIASGRLFGDGSFNKWRTLVLYGNIEDINYPTASGRYAIQNVTSEESSESVLAYFDEITKARGEIKSFQYSQHRNDIDIVSLWVMADTFYYFYDMELVKVFESQGIDAATNYVKNKYNNYLFSDNAEIVALSENLINTELEYIKYVGQYESDGCKLSDVTDECEIREYELHDDYLSGVNSMSFDVLNQSYGLLDQTVQNLLGENN